MRQSIVPLFLKDELSFVEFSFGNSRMQWRSFSVGPQMEYRAHPNSHRRIATSMTSAKEFFGKKPVSTIEEADIEAYKVWRINEHEVRDITVRHDLHALSILNPPFGWFFLGNSVREPTSQFFLSAFCPPLTTSEPYLTRSSTNDGDLDSFVSY